MYRKSLEDKNDSMVALDHELRIHALASEVLNASTCTHTIYLPLQNKRRILRYVNKQTF